MNFHKKIVATIEERMTSSRLPGKLILPVLNRPILSILINRLKTAASIDQILLGPYPKEDKNKYNWAVDEYESPITTCKKEQSLSK